MYRNTWQNEDTRTALLVALDALDAIGEPDVDRVGLQRTLGFEDALDQAKAVIKVCLREQVLFTNREEE